MPPARIIHTPEEISRIRRAAMITASVRDDLAAMARPGMTTFELDLLAGELIARTGGKSAFKNYCGFPGNICISVNDVVIHGIGRADVVLNERDIVSVDIGVRFDGALGDTALTFGFTEQPADIKRLMDSFSALISRGHTIVIIEHNMEVIKCADHVIDIGPEGGDRGGQLVACGTPEEIVRCEASHTGRFLKGKLAVND